VKTLLNVLLVSALGLFSCLASAQIGPCHSTDRFVVECIKPSTTDPMIQRFDHPHFVMIDREKLNQEQPLMVFLPGTKGQPPGPLNFLRTAATHGYRVISLEYNDEPSIAVFCPEHGGPACSARMRHMRIYGNTTLNPTIDNTRHEAIVERLYRLLRYLHQQHPQSGWDAYFNEHGMVWEKIALSGQSQGAGMAAFIGKQKLVNRIILFSSPWDFYHERGRQRILAPWLDWESRTPMNRWFAGYNARENTAELLSHAYQKLRIPREHVRIFTLPLPENDRGQSDNPFHVQGISNMAYEPDWIFFLTAPMGD
jgi:hypothetical protein